MTQSASDNSVAFILSELRKLDNESVMVRGKKMRPSQCYRLGLNPVHLMFNTNCPDTLKQKLRELLAKYTRDKNI